MLEQINHPESGVVINEEHPVAMGQGQYLSPAAFLQQAACSQSLSGAHGSDDQNDDARVSNQGDKCWQWIWQPVQRQE